MIEMHHGDEPEGLARFREKYIRQKGAVDAAAWKAFTSTCTADREALVNALYALQEGLCVYCERELSRRQVSSDAIHAIIDPQNRHVEHILSRCEHGEESLTYINMALSCKRAEGQNNAALRALESIPSGVQCRLDSCGEAKKNHSIPLEFLQNNSRYVIMGTDGKLVASDESYKAQVAGYVEGYLNLNKPSLISLRKERIDELENARQELADDPDLFLQYCREQLAKGPFRFFLRQMFANI